MLTVLLVILLLALAALAVVSFLFARMAVTPKKTSREAQIQYGREHNRLDESLLELPFELWERNNPNGDRIVARFYEGASTERIMMLIHGYNASWISMCKYIPMLLELGFSICIPDHQAHGESEGKYVTYGVLESRDCKDWLEILKQRYPQARLSILGESMGGATTLLLAEQCPELDFAVADCPYDSCENILLYSAKQSFRFPSGLMPLVKLCFRILTGCSMEDANPGAHLNELTVPTLLVHGDADITVPVSMARAMARMSDCITYWEVPGQPHAHVAVDHAQEYKKKIMDLMASLEVKA